MTDVTAALEWAHAGCSVIPVNTDGTKTPAVAWKRHQTEPATDEQIRTWWNQNPNYGIGVITGTVSGNLELLEIEGRATHLSAELKRLLADNGLTHIWDTLQQHIEISPSGGWHWLYRIDGAVAGNTKLARRPGPEGGVEVLVETRGEHGYTVVSPTGGHVHPSGKPWQRINGTPATIPTLSTDDRDALHLICGMLDEMPAADIDAPRPTTTHNPEIDGVRPGDDYNQKASWEDILEGWKPVRRLGGNTIGWRRPGKTDPGISATTGRNDADNLYVFSSSTEFEQEKAYSKFAAYTLLHHAGDYSAAARELGKQGYGSEAHAPLPQGNSPRELIGLSNPAMTPETTDGANAIVIDLDEHRQPPQAPLAMSDDGNALALIDRYGDRIRYCSDRGRWLSWAGHKWVWQPSGGGIVREYAKIIARTLAEDDDKKRNHKRRALSAKGTSDMILQASTDARITVTMDDLDTHAWELNTPGGIINLRTGELGPSDPSRLHTRSTTVTPDINADTALLHDFLDTTFGGDTELTQYMQRLVGYSAVGEVRDHILPFAYGSGGNGKSVFLEAVAGVLGDYATTSPNGFLMASNYAQHTTEIARLSGARFVVCNEVNEQDRFDEAKVKLLTGGDSLTARFMRQDDFTFKPTHHLWLAGNFQPAVSSGGDSFWRRLRLVPFTHTVPDEKRVEDLQTILAVDHGPAVLAWIMSGAADYAKNGLGEPKRIREATKQYATDIDTVGRFIEDECHLVTGPSAKQLTIKVTDLRHAYEQWCRENGEDALSGRSFTSQLARHGVLVGRNAPRPVNGGSRVYGGISLMSHTDDYQEADRGEE